MRRGAFLALAVLALAACGSGSARLSKSGYEAKLQSALAADGLPPHVAFDTAVDTLSGIALRFDAISKRLSGLKTPTDVQALNDRLAAGAAKAAASLQALLASVKDVSVAKRDRLLAQFDASHIPGLDEFDRAAAGLAAKGYRFTQNAGR